MKIDFTSAKTYNRFLRVILAVAGLVLLVGPSVWLSRVMGFNNVVVSGHHILFGNSGLEPFLQAVPVGTRGETISLNPQLIMVFAFVFLLCAFALTFLRKINFFPIIFIILSMAFAWLACDHFGWLEQRMVYEKQWGLNLYIILMAVAMVLTLIAACLQRLNVHSGEFKDHLALLTMLLPGSVILILFSYLPMPGILLAFKNMRLHGGNVFQNFFKSPWVGFNNFRFIFTTPDAYLMTRNTVLYNLVFIVLGLIVAVSIAIGITELSNRRTAKLYQTLYFLPFFLSWVVVSYLSFALLSYEYGVFNNFLRAMGRDTVNFYMNPQYWPAIFVFANIWKYAGHGSIIYTATIVGMDAALFEAAAIDGANRFKQIWYITLPMLKPTMILLTILAFGRIFSADFGLFYLLPRGAGPLRSVRMVLDVYVFESLSGGTINMGMVAAVGLYQSVVGFVLILFANYVVKKLSPENTLL
jgi:putative aldouronate transport system permease protein